jgi:hypothetical protein
MVSSKTGVKVGMVLIANHLQSSKCHADNKRYLEEN